MHRCALLALAISLAACTTGVDGDHAFESGGATASAGAGSSAATEPGPGSGPGGTGTGGGDATASAGGSTSAASDATSGAGGGLETSGADGDQDPGTSGANESGTGGDDSSSEAGSTGEGAADDGDAGGDVGSDACGFPLDGPWIEIEYWQAGVPATSPQWSYSDTPGWGEAQWAASNASWPEVWDLFQNINVTSDPIGVVAVVGSSAQLQLMLGFEELLDYDSATLCVEGRSVSTSASVQFEAYNPLTGLGNVATMAHDWSVHAVGIELGQPFTIGGGVQAVRLDATGGSASLGVKRMRLVLHGAVY